MQAWSLRLSDGRRILLGEDRPIPRMHGYTRLMRDAGEAMAAAARLQPVQLPHARGSPGLLGLAFTRGPDWP